MIWAIMIVSSQLVRTDGHVRPDLVLNVVPASAKRDGWRCSTASPPSCFAPR